MLILIPGNQRDDLCASLHKFEFAKRKTASETDVKANTFKNINVCNCSEEFALEFIP